MKKYLSIILIASITSNALDANSFECEDNECIVQVENETCTIDNESDDEFSSCEEDCNCKIDENKTNETKNGINIKFGSDVKIFTDIVKDFANLIKTHKGDLKAVKNDQSFESIKPKLNELFTFIKENVPNKMMDLKTQLLIGRALIDEQIKDLNEWDQFGSLPSAIINFLEIAYTLGQEGINIIEILIHEINNNQNIKELVS